MEQILIPQKYRDLAEKLRQVMLELTGVDACKQTRARAVVVPRAMVAWILVSEGCTTFQAGALLGKNHATISHYKDLMADFLSSPGYDAERELWTKFQERI